MTNGSGSNASKGLDFAYFDDRRLRAAREALRNFPISVSTETIYSGYLARYDYDERHEDIEAWVLRETQKQCLALYPDGQHPFMKLERLPDDYLCDRRKPPSCRTLREITRVRHIVRAMQRRAQRHNRPVAQTAGTPAPAIPRVRG